MKTMIKTTYLILGTALLLSSCAQEEMPNNATISGSDRRIVFRTSLPEVTSRAEVVSTDDLKKFHVTAFNPKDPNLTDGPLEEFIKNEELEWDENSKSYNSENCLWPEKGQEENELTFFAYYPDLLILYPESGVEEMLENASTLSGNVPTFDYKLKDFRVAENISKQVDFISAYTRGSMANNLFSGVKLEFQHQLSRIEVKAKGSNKSSKIEIAGIRIGGICMQGTHNFKAEEKAGDWTLDETKGKTEYIYGPGENIVAIDDMDTEVSIMGESNYAMLLPSFDYEKWDFANDNTNSNGGTYLSVLLRLIDKTPGDNHKQQYPYFDNSRGQNALNIPKVYLAVDNNEIITDNPGQLYKDVDGKYYTDSAMKTEYNAPQESEVKEFGWAALPVTVDWEPGRTYTYTLDYSYGVGLHDPGVANPDDPSHGPKAGDSIISDMVGVTVSVKGWDRGTDSENRVPR